MQLNVQQLEAWLWAVRVNLGAKGITDKQLADMKKEDPKGYKEMEKMVRDMMPSNFHPAIVMEAMPMDHPALRGPANVAIHIYEVFFE